MGPCRTMEGHAGIPGLGRRAAHSAAADARRPQGQGAAAFGGIGGSGKSDCEMIDAAISRTEAGQDLSLDEVAAAFEEIIGGRCTEDEIARWLLALNQKGPSVGEVAGAALALRRK